MANMTVHQAECRRHEIHLEVFLTIGAASGSSWLRSASRWRTCNGFDVEWQGAAVRDHLLNRSRYRKDRPDLGEICRAATPDVRADWSSPSRARAASTMPNPKPRRIRSAIQSAGRGIRSLWNRQAAEHSQRTAMRDLVRQRASGTNLGSLLVEQFCWPNLEGLRDLPLLTGLRFAALAPCC